MSNKLTLFKNEDTIYRSNNLSALFEIINVLIKVNVNPFDIEIVDNKGDTLYQLEKFEPTDDAYVVTNKVGDYFEQKVSDMEEAAFAIKMLIVGGDDIKNIKIIKYL